MKPNNRVNSMLTIVLTLLAVSLSKPKAALAHCDRMDGPVVAAARKALELGNVNLVLIWVHEKDEPQVRQAFQKTLSVRKLSPEAKELADLYFFETVVRLHRAGEGAPYTGLKPAGGDIGPAIAAADKAVHDSSAEPVLTLLTGSIQRGVDEHFKDVISKKNFKAVDVSGGRQFVRAYVEFIHYVKRLHDVAAGAAVGHFPELPKGGERDED